MYDQYNKKGHLSGELNAPIAGLKRRKKLKEIP